jgi:palmitoyltransferase
MKFDHHCIWINQCVGYKNYKWFLSFLFLHALLTAYGFVAGVGIMLHLAEERKLFFNYYIDTKTGKQVPPSFLIVI